MVLDVNVTVFRERDLLKRERHLEKKSTNMRLLSIFGRRE